MHSVLRGNIHTVIFLYAECIIKFLVIYNSTVCTAIYQGNEHLFEKYIAYIHGLSLMPMFLLLIYIMPRNSDYQGEKLFPLYKIPHPNRLYFHSMSARRSQQFPVPPLLRHKKLQHPCKVLKMHCNLLLSTSQSHYRFRQI